MKTKIFGGIAIVVIALAVAFNVSLNLSKSNNTSLLALANVEALADDENSLPGLIKVQCKLDSTCEDVYYVPITDKICQKVTVTEKITECIGIGSISCTPSFEADWEYGDFANCSECSPVIS